MSWLKSDYCTECDGEGFIRFKSHETEEYVEYDSEQCEECERLHLLEVRADMRMDAIKEGI